MRKIIVSEYVTLDGIMEEPGTWSFPFWNEEASQFKFEELFAADALLLGRVTYQGFAKAWPTMTDTGAYGERMNSLPKYVVSTTLSELTWNARLLTGELVEAVSTLKREDGQDLVVFGSGQLVHQLQQHALIDEYRLMLYPVLLGNGKRLFPDGIEQQGLRLVETKTFSSGVVVLSYQSVKQ